MKKRKFYVVFGVLFLQIVTSITLATSVTYGMDYAKAPQGFQVWGIDLSGLNQEEAYQRLEGEMPSEVSYQDSMYPLTVTQSQEGLRDWLNSQFAPESNSWWVNALNNLKRMGPKQLSPEFLDRNEIYPQLENMAQQINQQGMPASIQMQTGHFTIQKGSPTIVMDVPASWEKLNQSGGSKSVPLVVNSQEIAPNEKDLQKIKDKIGDYTYFF